MAGVDDELVTEGPVLQRIDDFTAFKAVKDEGGYDALRRSEDTGHPVGAPEFVAGLKRFLGRPIARRVPGAQTHPARD